MRSNSTLSNHTVPSCCNLGGGSRESQSLSGSISHRSFITRTAKRNTKQEERHQMHSRRAHTRSLERVYKGWLQLEGLMPAVC